MCPLKYSLIWWKLSLA
jgi:glutathione S-transferase